MKYFLLLLLLIPIFIMPVYAQSFETLVFVQNTLRDSEGNLVTSFEVSKIGYLQKVALERFLDAEVSNNDPIVMINNQKMQIIEREISLSFDSDNVISDTTLNASLENGQIITLVRLIHDGIPVTSGDELTLIWIFVRSVV